MSVYKRLHKSDVITSPYEANKLFNLSYNTFSRICSNVSGSDDGVKIYVGTKLTGSFTPELEATSEGEYQRLIYDSINHLYYQQYDEEIDNDINKQSLYYVSSSQFRATSSYFDYNSNDRIVKYFPTASNSTIRVISIPKKFYGNEIVPNNFTLSSSAYDIIDDGYGNIIDTNTDEYIGNIFYKQGIVVITNELYQCIFPIPPVAVKNTFRFNELTANKVFNLLSNDITYCGATVNTSSIEFFETSSGFLYSTTGSNFVFLNSTVGSYSSSYFFKDSNGLCSNPSTINIEVYRDCDFFVDVTEIAYTGSSSPCTSNVCDIDFVKIPLSSSCTSTIYPIDFGVNVSMLTSSRANGIKDFMLSFTSTDNATWEISKNGGATYETLLSGSSIISGSTSLLATDSPFKNNFSFLLRATNTSSSFVEYQFQLNPLSSNDYGFNQKKKYDYYDIPSTNCYPNIYKVLSSGCNISSSSYSYTGEMSGIPLSENRLAVIGCRGSIKVTAATDCCGTCEKIIYFNGDCYGNEECTADELVLEILPTSTPNNYLVFSKLTNGYLSAYTNWITSGSGISVISDNDGLWLEVTIASGSGDSYLTLNCSTWCDNLSKTLKFNYNPLTTTTTLPISTTTSTTTDPDRASEGNADLYADLELIKDAETTSPYSGQTIRMNLSVFNRGPASATNIVVKDELPSGMTYVSAISSGTNLISGSVIGNIPIIYPNQYDTISFYVSISGSVGQEILNFAQIMSANETDLDSVHGVVDDGDDESYLELTIIGTTTTSTTTSTTISGSGGTTTTSTTLAPCVPIIRPYPYTNYICDCGLQFFSTGYPKGRIIVNAINQLTGTLEGLEYSFSGDFDENYDDENMSECLADGLYTVWVRVKDRPDCKSSITVQVNCSLQTENQGTTTTTLFESGSWSFLDSVCVDVTSTVTTSANSLDFTYQSGCNNTGLFVAITSVTGASGQVQYKIDNGAYQGNSLFISLSDGTHTITVKDSAGNTKTKSFTRGCGSNQTTTTTTNAQGAVTTTTNLNSNALESLSFNYSTESDYNSGYNPISKFGTFTTNGQPVIWDVGYNTLGYTYGGSSLNVTTLGFTHVTPRSAASLIGILSPSALAIEINADQDVFSHSDVNYVSDATTLCIGYDESSGNVFYNDDVAIDAHLDYINVDVDIMSFDVELVNLKESRDAIIRKRFCLEDGKYLSAINGGETMPYKNWSDEQFYQNYLKAYADYWVRFINILKSKNAAGSLTKTTWYGQGSNYSYANYPYSDESIGYSTTPNPQWSTRGNNGAKISDVITYQNAGQIYCGEPYGITDSTVLASILSNYESQRKADGNAAWRRSITHIKPFRENYTAGNADGVTPCTDCAHASSNKQIAQGMAYIPFFTGNGAWVWGTYGRKEFGQAIDHFIAARKICSYLNPIVDGTESYIIPEISLNGVQWYGNSNDWGFATDISNPDRYTAHTIINNSTKFKDFPLVRAIKRGNSVAICATRVGGYDTGTTSFQIRIPKSNGTYYVERITLSGRDWFIGRIWNINV